MRIRTKDIAQKAGVSLGTVDRVLHNRDGVSEKSRKKVLAIMEELGYEPNRYASALASNRTLSFACLIPGHSEGEYWESVEEGIRGAVKDFADLGAHCAFFYYDSFDYSSFAVEGEKILGGDFDAVIIGPTVKEFTLPFTSSLDGKGTPYVFVDSFVSGSSPLAYYGQDAHSSGYFTGSIVLPLRVPFGGTIAVFETTRGKVTGSNQQILREEGFRRWIGKSGAEVILRKVDLPQDGDPSACRKVLKEFFSSNPDIKTGLFFNSRAYIVGEFILEEGVKDFDLTGYDLLPRNVGCLRKGAISRLISQRPLEQGYGAVKALTENIILKKDVKKENLMPIDLLTADNIDFYIR